MSNGRRDNPLRGKAERQRAEIPSYVRCYANKGKVQYSPGSALSRYCTTLPFHVPDPSGSQCATYDLVALRGEEVQHDARLMGFKDWVMKNGLTFQALPPTRHVTKRSRRAFCEDPHSRQLSAIMANDCFGSATKNTQVSSVTARRLGHESPRHHQQLAAYRLGADYARLVLSV